LSDDNKDLASTGSFPRDEFWERMQEGFAAQERERTEVEVEAALLRSKRQPARPDGILAARHAATMQYSMMKHAALMNRNGNGEHAAHFEASDLGEKLERAVHMALNEVVAILGFSLDPDDRAFSSILKAKTRILSSVLSAQVRIDETRFDTGKGLREFWPPQSARYLIWRGQLGLATFITASR
jgi:hypothetical protein